MVLQFSFSPEHTGNVGYSSSKFCSVSSLWEGLVSLLDRSLFFLPGVIRNIPQAMVTSDVTVLTISGKILGLLGKFLMMISA